MLVAVDRDSACRPSAARSRTKSARRSDLDPPSRRSAALDSGPGPRAGRGPARLWWTRTHNSPARDTWSCVAGNQAAGHRLLCRPSQPPTTSAFGPGVGAALRSTLGFPDLLRRSLAPPGSAPCARVLGGMRDTDFGGTDPHGIRLSSVLALVRLSRPRARRGGRRGSGGRSTSGWGPGADTSAVRALASHGDPRVAIEDPMPSTKCRMSSRRTRGSSRCRCRSTARGSGVEALERGGAGAALVTPAHQCPIGACSAARGAAAWSTGRAGTPRSSIEDDYDAEFRYDRRRSARCRDWTPSASSTPARRARRSRR